MSFLRPSREEEAALSAVALNDREIQIDDETTCHRKICHRLSQTTVLREADSAVRATGPTATIELKVHLRTDLLAANLVDDIPDEIV